MAELYRVQIRLSTVEENLVWHWFHYGLRAYPQAQAVALAADHDGTPGNTQVYRTSPFDTSVQGWINHVRYADTWGLREHVLGEPLKKS
jgi:hypothetical protein